MSIGRPEGFVEMEVSMSILDKLNSDEFVILDGAMGTMLQKSGLKLGERPEILNITNPDSITEVHRMYIDSGSDIVYTNTFGANSHKLEGTGCGVDEVISCGIACAKKAVSESGRDSYVALDIGPIGELLEPSGTLSFESAYEIFKEQMVAGEKSGADLIIIETMTDLYEVKAAILAAKENTSLPVFCTMTFEKNRRTFTGCSLDAFAYTVTGLGVDALGINCSLGPDEILPMTEELSKYTELPIIVKANAGLPNLNTGEYDIDEVEYSEYAKKIASLGVKYLGGCCGTSPKYIKKIAEVLEGVDLKNRKVDIRSIVCSPTKTVVVDEIRVVGERINPTGKKRFKQALIDGEVDYILGQAVEQVDAGAHILDVNVGLPEIDEKYVMSSTVKAIQSITDVPLQIDSSNYSALESGLRVYNGKPLVNSVNGEKKSMDAVLPLVKKYGAGVVALTLDEGGIPKTAEGRLEIAKKIVDEAEKYGIKREDIYVDCLTLTVSAEQDSAKETLRAIELVKKNLGVKTILGVSNISFGLPNRELVNSTFLTLAMKSGLDLAIINPNIDIMMDTVSAFRVLYNLDRDSEEFVDRFSDFEKHPTSSIGRNKRTKTDISDKPVSNIDITEAISKGMKKETKEITEKLLVDKSEIEIINELLIPALDNVGLRYERGEIFLPQLIKAASASQEAFEVIKKRIANSGGESVSKGKIVIATVKGDIHDIGKNIVKVILENYGYQVVDLGRDVDIDTVVDSVVENDAKLVGLSALMTTTLKSMEETIVRLRERTPECKIMVGGAVLTEDYAKKIDADFYCADAKKSVECAKMVLG